MPCNFFTLAHRCFLVVLIKARLLVVLIFLFNRMGGEQARVYEVCTTVCIDSRYCDTEKKVSRSIDRSIDGTAVGSTVHSEAENDA